MLRTLPVAAVIAAAALGAAVLAVIVWLADSGESAGREEGVTLSQVADDPRAFAGQTVTISGEFAENDYLAPSDAAFALVVGDDAGRRLLVLPQPQAAVPAGVDENSVLRIRGTVRVIEPESPGEGDEGLLSQGGLLAQSGAEAVIEATSVEYAGAEPDRTDREVAIVTVAQVIRDPRAFDDELLRVSGRAYRIGERGFVLAGDRRAIFVGAPASELESLAPGDRVEISAELERLSRFRANTIAEALSGTPETEAAAPPEVDLRRMPSEPGELFLVLRGLRTSGG